MGKSLSVKRLWASIFAAATLAAPPVFAEEAAAPAPGTAGSNNAGSKSKSPPACSPGGDFAVQCDNFAEQSEKSCGDAKKAYEEQKKICDNMANAMKSAPNQMCSMRDQLPQCLAQLKAKANAFNERCQPKSESCKSSCEPERISQSNCKDEGVRNSLQSKMRENRKQCAARKKEAENFMADAQSIAPTLTDSQTACEGSNSQSGGGPSEEARELARYNNTQNNPDQFKGLTDQQIDHYIETGEVPQQNAPSPTSLSSTPPSGGTGSPSGGGNSGGSSPSSAGSPSSSPAAAPQQSQGGSPQQPSSNSSSGAQDKAESTSAVSPELERDGVTKDPSTTSTPEQGFLTTAPESTDKKREEAAARSPSSKESKAHSSTLGPDGEPLSEPEMAMVRLSSVSGSARPLEAGSRAAALNSVRQNFENSSKVPSHQGAWSNSASGGGGGGLTGFASRIRSSFSSWLSGGSSTASEGLGGIHAVNAGANPHGVDLSKFLPGKGLKMSGFSDRATGSANGIHDSNANLFEKIQDHYKILEPSLLKEDDVSTTAAAVKK